MSNKSKIRGFTLIELLVVIAIIGLLSSVVLASLNTARMKARDARRLSDMHQIQIALDLYYSNNGQYPGNTDDDNSGWDMGCNGVGDPFISPLETNGTISKTPCDPTIQNGGYAYYRYGAGSCNVPSLPAFYVLGVIDMETSGNPYPSSPGWSCPLRTLRDWQGEFEWVTGKYE